MSWQETLGIISGLLAFIFYVQVFYQTLSGQIRPNPTSWFIWTFNDTLILAGSWSVGAWNSLWVPLVYSVFGWFVFIAAARSDRRPLTTLELSCLIGSLCGWGAFFFTHALWSIVIGSVVNSLAAIPTIRIAFREPQRESLSAWVLVSVSVVCMLLSSERLELSLLLFPVDSIVNCSVIVFGLLRHRIQYAPRGI
jgi:hypothetical protein